MFRALGRLALLIPLCVAGCSAPQKSLFSVSPASIVITLGQWITKEDREFFEVEVESQGDSRSAALNEVFREAVRQAFGALVVEERVVQDGEAVRDNLLVYSAGYVESYRVKSVSHQGGTYRVKAIVWVAKSKLADRLFLTQTTAGRLDGVELHKKFNSYLEQANTSDRVLETLLLDFPEKSFFISLGRTASNISGRSLNLVIPFEIRWNEEYVSALKEILIRTRDASHPLGVQYVRNPKQSVIAIKESGAWLKTYAGYSDDRKEKIFQRNLVESSPQLMVSLYGKGRDRIYSSCIHLDSMSSAYFGEGYQPNGQFFSSYSPEATFAIYGDFRFISNFKLQIPEDAQGIELADSVEMEIVRKNRCSN